MIEGNITNSNSRTLSNSQLNPIITVNSGQTFLWEKYENSWYGVYNKHILKFSLEEINSKNNEYIISFESFPRFDNWEQFVFRLDDDINRIFALFSEDIVLTQLFKNYAGLRLMRQDPYQCMISFACSSNTNIAMIRRMLLNLSRKFGSRIQMDGNNFFTFPSIKRLHNASINELCSCGTGFRAKTIKSIAERIVDGSINIDELRKYRYSEAKELLLSICGIGNKIADCILLFSLEKTEAFPIDIWIARSLYAYYRSLFSKQTSKLTFKSAKLTVNQYNLLSKIMQEHFGKYAGYAQQYLYYHMRHQANKKW